VKLHEMQQGDIVAIRWPAHDYDTERAGTDQIVQVGNVLGGKKKGTKVHAVIVNPIDRDTLLPVGTRAMRAISPDAEVLDLVERSRYSSDDEHRGEHSEDIMDPMQGRRR
jgi:hypothetical protein